MALSMSGSGEGGKDLHRAALKRLCISDADLREQPFESFLSKYKDEEKARVFYQKHLSIIQQLSHNVQVEEAKIVSNGLSQPEYQVLGSPPSLGKYLKRDVRSSPLVFEPPRSQTHSMIAKSLTNRQMIAQEQERKAAEGKALLQQRLQMTAMKRERLAAEQKESAKVAVEKHEGVLVEKVSDKRRYLESKQAEMERKCIEQRLKHEQEIRARRQELQKVYQEKVENARRFAELQENQQHQREYKRLEIDRINEQKRIEFQKQKEASTNAYQEKIRAAEEYRAQMEADRKRQEEILKERTKFQNDMALRKQEMIQRQKTLETRQEYQQKMNRLLQQQANVRRMQQEDMARKQQLKQKNKEQIQNNMRVKEQQAAEARRKAIEIQASLEEKKTHIKIMQQKQQMDMEVKRQALEMELETLQTRQMRQRQAQEDFVQQNNKLELAKSPDELAKMCQTYAARYGQ